MFLPLFCVVGGGGGGGLFVEQENSYLSHCIKDTTFLFTLFFSPLYNPYNKVSVCVYVCTEGSR